MHWNIYKSSQYRLGYHVDGWVLAMFAVKLLDVVTTYLLSALRLGFEMNPVCAALMRHSLLWSPVYLMAFPLVVPLLPEIPRRAFVLYFLASGLMAGLNNLGGILFHHFFIIDTFGFWMPEGFCVAGAFVFFVYELYRSSKNRVGPVVAALACLGVLLVIEGAFYLLGIYLREG